MKTTRLRVMLCDVELSLIGGHIDTQLYHGLP